MKPNEYAMFNQTVPFLIYSTVKIEELFINSKCLHTYRLSLINLSVVRTFNIYSVSFGAQSLRLLATTSKVDRRSKRWQESTEVFHYHHCPRDRYQLGSTRVRLLQYLPEELIMQIVSLSGKSALLEL